MNQESMGDAAPRRLLWISLSDPPPARRNAEFTEDEKQVAVEILTNGTA